MENWHYTDLLKAHKLFIEVEGRFKFYDAYMKAREPNAWLTSSDPPLKEGLLLFGWVLSWEPYFQGVLEQFYENYKDLFSEVKRFENETIVIIDFSEGIKESISSIFDKLALYTYERKERFELTGTSKILHVILPELFVMWDIKIRRGILGDSNKKRGKDYAYKFLPDMQNFAKQFLDSYIEENGGDHENASRQISQMADGYTLAKLIDELNYLRFTKGRTLAKIRSISL